MAGGAIPIEPTILFEDNHLVVLSKPAGLLSQGERKGDPNLVDWLRERLGRNYVGLIHRLDRNTSGVMVVAKRTKAANRLSEALRAGSLARTYLGWVHGRLPASARWEHHLVKDERANRSRAFDRPQPGSKAAVLTVLRRGEGRWEGQPLSLAEFALETGRSHQIRAQAAKAGFPLLGDPKYGRRDGFPRPALHSWRLRFPHPMTGENLAFEAALPPDLAAITSEPPIEAPVP